ncbi:MAG TPA: hypothetical protein VG982_03185 [Candidatus Paceibacterota bacterium]|jgi:hypothetical protein|nr:hypothetical protein [Candidatus Paceibacterota bacterium]
MDPNLDARLKAIEIKLDNMSRMVSRMRGSQKRAAAFRVFYWLLIIGLSVGAFYFIQPYLTQLKSVYTGFSDIGGSLNGTKDPQRGSSAPDSQSIGNLIDQLKQLNN